MNGGSRRRDDVGTERGAPRERAAASLRPYAPPRLVPLGDVRSLILGASPGIGDSATNPQIYHP